MASLATELLKVLANNPNPTYFSPIYEDLLATHTNDFQTLSVHDSNATPETRVESVCKASQILFGSSVILPQDSTYTSELQKNWSTTCHLPSHCIILIKNTLQLSLALKLITFFQSPFAVRSGGHNANPGFGSVGETGVLLDLGALNQVCLSPAREYVSVGPGAKWGSVYEELEKYQLTVAGGRVSDVGVGGLILGGGMSHFSNYWGMVCDNVQNFEVVLADSNIVNANAEENPDLFRVLKGGGPNFGIVTRFDLRTFPDHKVWYTFKIYGRSEATRVIEAAVKIQEAMETDDHIGFFLTANGGVLVAGMLYRGEVDSQPSAFNVFDQLTPLAIAVPPTNGSAYSVAVAANMAGAAKREIGGVSILVDASLYSELYNIYLDVLGSVPVSSSYSLAFTHQPVAASSVQKSAQTGGNYMNISPVSQSWLAIFVQWSEDAEDEIARSQIRQIVSEFQAKARESGQLLDFEFMNDTGYTQNPLKSYGAESLQKLNEVMNKWDPEGIFQRLQNGGFLLSKV